MDIAQPYMENHAAFGYIIALFCVFLVSRCGGEGAHIFDVRSEFSFENQYKLLTGEIEMLERKWRFVYNDRFMELQALMPADGDFRLFFNASTTCYNTGLGYYVLQDGVLECQYCSRLINAVDLPLHWAEEDLIYEETEDEVDVDEINCRPLMLYRFYTWFGDIVIREIWIWRNVIEERLMYFEFMPYNSHLHDL